MSAALLFAIRYRNLLAIGAGVIAILLAAWWGYSAIYAAGQADTQKKWDDAQRAAEAEAAADTLILQDHMAGIDQSIAIDMEAINAIRTVYRDKIRTVAVSADRPDCALADGLRAEINAAAGEYAATARSGNASVPTAKPTR